LVLAGTAAATTRVPHLRSASAPKRHVVVSFTLGEQAPGRIVVASKPATELNGSFVKANVVLSEPLHATKTSTGYRARTVHRLRPGRYWVEISGIRVQVDCMPAKPCKPDWSNVRRVTVK
jgi:hypothetical protein